ncbi:universal stress protein [Natrononativus amylolyticus]|uniref:universal stress protein n=1 Tax=Natrononativus amylolyticus TaxID=2963434 RepID=UPI0020CCBD67|nr:universal stress protein [Natrononativus amylolyticus]
MSGPTGGGPVLVAVASPAHVEQLVRTAGDLARVGDGVVRIVTVVVKSHDSPFSVYADETIVERFSGDSRELLEAAAAVAPDDVTVERDIVVGRSVADGVLRAVAAAGASALVIGWERGRGRTDAVFGTTADRLLERAPCDLYVERIGREANGVDSILLPVAGGPHVRPAAVAAKAIAARNDATVIALSVAAPDLDEDAARGAAERARDLLAELPGPAVAVETRVREGPVLETIAEAAGGHDVLVVGATRQGAFHRRLVGSVARDVVHRTERTVILARAGDAVDGSILARLRRLTES